jgi:small subunit ribosomal protein S6
VAIYEGMFLLDSGRASKDWEGTKALVDNVLERYGAKSILKDRWDERKLAYSIKRQKRGTYYLAYFDAPGDAVTQIRRDLVLTEGVLRFMILAWPHDAALPDKIEIKRMMTDDDAKAGLFGGEGRGRFGDRSDFGDRSAEEVPEEFAAKAAAETEGEAR